MLALAKIKNIKIEQYRALFRLFTLFTALFLFCAEKVVRIIVYFVYSAAMKIFSKNYKKLLKTVFILGNNSYICTTKIK